MGGGGVVVRRKERKEEARGGEGESIPEDGVVIAMLTSTLVTLRLRRASRGKMMPRWKMEKRVTYG